MRSTMMSVSLVTLVLGAVACGSPDASTLYSAPYESAGNGPGHDAGSHAQSNADAGSASGDEPDAAAQADPPPPPPPTQKYPAPHQGMGQSVSLGGPLLRQPHVYVITFNNDPNRATVETFMSALGQTSYWTTVTDGYDVGAMTSTPLRLNANAPASTDDPSIATMIAQNISKGAFPAPDANSLYAVFYPNTTQVTEGSSVLCQGVGGYHSEAVVNNKPFAYTVLPRCGGMDVLTSVVAHELLEAVTDPLPFSNPAHYLPDADHMVLAAFLGGEVGDLCQFETVLNVTPAGFPHALQRIWNNKAAAAGHDPCQPAASARPYFNAAPLLTDDVSISIYDGKVHTTKGIKATVGQQKTIEIDLFSDGPTGPWTVEALDAEQQPGGPATVELTLDKTTGKNGDKLHLTVKPLSRVASIGGVAFFLKSTLGADIYWSYGFIGN